METIAWILGGLFVNSGIGAGVCASLDTDDQVFYNWYKQDPSDGLFSFLVLQFWPVMAVLMWRYRRDMKRDRSH